MCEVCELRLPDLPATRRESNTYTVPTNPPFAPYSLCILSLKTREHRKTPPTISHAGCCLDQAQPFFLQNVVPSNTMPTTPRAPRVSRIQTARDNRVTTPIPRYLDGPSTLYLCVKSARRPTGRLCSSQTVHNVAVGGEEVWVTSLSLLLLRIPAASTTDTQSTWEVKCTPAHHSTAPATTGTWTLGLFTSFPMMLTPEWLPSHSIGLGNLGREWAKNKIYDKQLTEKRDNAYPHSSIPERGR
jgi:hypothetical protein